MRRRTSTTPPAAVLPTTEEEKALAAELEVLQNLFTYHPPDEDQRMKYAALRAKALEMAVVIHKCCPKSPDRTHAMRKLRETIMTANASIATGGGHYQ